MYVISTHHYSIWKPASVQLQRISILQWWTSRALWWRVIWWWFTLYDFAKFTREEMNTEIEAIEVINIFIIIFIIIIFISIFIIAFIFNSY